MAITKDQKSDSRWLGSRVTKISSIRKYIVVDIGEKMGLLLLLVVIPGIIQRGILVQGDQSLDTIEDVTGNKTKNRATS